MEEKIYQVNSPLEIQYGWDKEGRPKIFSLNLNIYRNFNRFSLGKAKDAYSELMAEPVKELPSFNKVEIRYVLFTGSKRKVDISNICTIVDKFFCDVLTKEKKLSDDNYSILPKVSYEFGGIDVNNPRVEIYIKELL